MDRYCTAGKLASWGKTASQLAIQYRQLINQPIGNRRGNNSQLVISILLINQFGSGSYSRAFPLLGIWYRQLDNWSVKADN